MANVTPSNDMNVGIYHWKFGDVALAKITKKFYAKVQVVKDENGIFYDEKVLGFSPGVSENSYINVTTQLCYYVEIIRTRRKLWVPYTSLQLAERSRPFYGPANKIPTALKLPSTPKKRITKKIKKDDTLPLNVQPSGSKEHALTPINKEINEPIEEWKNNNCFKEFTRLGEEWIFDEFYSQLLENGDKKSLHYVQNVDTTTEEKFRIVTEETNVSGNEIANYLHQCWKYNILIKEPDDDSESDKEEEVEKYSGMEDCKVLKSTQLHTSWCLVCGKGEQLNECTDCPTSFHPQCRKDWSKSIIHRKGLLKKVDETIVKKILSSTRVKCSANKEEEEEEEEKEEDIGLCPSCQWGPPIGYNDVVWYKLGTCSWWPARVLMPGTAPPCLVSRSHSSGQLPLKYYSTNNHSWGDVSRMSLFMTSHISVLDTARDETLKPAVLDACDDYITVYLT